MPLREDVPQGYSRQYMKCRALGHMWDHLGDAIPHPSMSWVRGTQSICMTCDTTRTRWLSRDGARWGAAYAYPDGYQLKRDKVDGRVRALAPAVQDWRREFISNLDFGDATPPTPTKRAKAAANKRK